MKSKTDRLRREIAAIRHREPFQTRRYPAELQRAVVAYAHEQLRGGQRRRRVAHELGLTEQTLAQWVRTASPVLRPVTIAASPRRRSSWTGTPAECPVLVLAGGHRIEGLNLDQLVTVVRVLA